MKSTTQAGENSGFLGSISTSSLRNLLPKSKLKRSIKKSSNFENTPPPDPNILQLKNSSQLPSKSLTSDSIINTSDGERQIPLSANPSVKEKVIESEEQKEELTKLDPSVKEKVIESEEQKEELTKLDPSVKVVVRIRPKNGQEKEVDGTIRKVSSDSLSVGDRKFAFDSVLDTNSSQEEVFQQIGVPLVKNALAGYNTSILSYGQTGSGKTYTMWGPPSAMIEDPSPRSHQGIVPRIFQVLFSEIQREQENSDGRQLNYQCRCSFLEIYNEQIGDLLDPSQRNLEIKDDPKNGFYVENLTEEYVSSYEDVTQLLIKGLSSKKVGATTVNSKSSRSHIVFTFVIESWCKGASSKCFSSSKTSRISLIDLAGLDRNKLEDVGRQHLQEDKNVKKSLSQLGYLVNTLAKETQPEKPEDAPYGGSCLTRILRESLGGNAKLTVICNISADNRNSSEILSTLRFGQRIKSVRNEPVINEISEDDVNGLSDQIRQLKEELIRAKSDEYSSVASKSGNFKGWNARESLNQLRVSLNRSLILPRIDNNNEYEEELNIGEEDIKELRQQLDDLHSSFGTNLRDSSDKRGSLQFSSVKESFETDSLSEYDIHCLKETEIEEIDLDELPPMENPASADDLSIKNRISISPPRRSSILQEPTLSESPKIANNPRKSMSVPSALLASQNNASEPEVLRQSLKYSEHIRSSLRSSKTFLGPTESLAASLQRGLQIIDNHQNSSAPNRSSISFSFEHLMLKPSPEADKVNASVQTVPNGKSCPEPSTPLLCSSCQRKFDHNNPNGVRDSLKTSIVAVDNQQRDGENTAVVRDSAEATEREKTLESVCKEQATKIEQLNQLVEQYKLGRETPAIEHGLEPAKNEIIPFEQSNNGENGIDYFDISEKEALLQEIQTLKSKLQSHAAPSPNMSTEKLRSSLLSRSFQLRKSLDCRNNSEEELEKERQRWMEMESDWISLTDELRMDIESIRFRAEKVETELKLEKKCTEELDDALSRSVLCHARMVEHYADLQEKHNDLVTKHRAIMEGIAEVKKAAVKAGSKGHGARFAKSLAAELSALRVQREKEKELLKKENRSLRVQLRDTAEAVHAAGELLVRLREAEQAASTAEESFGNVQQENEKLKKQLDKLKRKHKMEMVTMKQYLAESRLPESALQPLYREDSDVATTTQNSSAIPYDDQAWRAEFGPIYQEHY